MFESKHLHSMRRGINLFNQKKYWDCHEELETPWMEEASSVRYIFWTVIQVAVALHHCEQKNFTGARSMIAKAKEKLKKTSSITSPYLKKINWQGLSKLIENHADNGQEDDFTALLSFKFPNPEAW